MLSIFFVIVLFAVTGIWILKKINGPINGMIKHLEILKNGDLRTSIELRQHDEFKDVASALNNMQEQIRQRCISTKILYEEISQNIEKMHEDVASKKQTKDNIQIIYNQIQKLQKRLL